MNPKIEVDHQLFTTCRLCLDEKGKYQIVPTIQENIKFAFDIELLYDCVDVRMHKCAKKKCKNYTLKVQKRDVSFILSVELNNGLPQLICVNCESLLSQFVCTKQLFQEKQKRLHNRHGLVRVIRDDTRKEPLQKSQKPNQDTINSQNSTSEQESINDCNKDSVDQCDEENIQPDITKKAKIVRDKSWRNTFIKSFVCRFCTKTFKEKKSITSHLKRHDTVLSNFKNIVPCFVKVEKIDQKPNITGSKKFVVFDDNRIIQNKKTLYYVAYTHKTNNNSTPSSDIDEQITNKKSKRQRLDSHKTNNNNTPSSDEDEQITNKKSKRQCLDSLKTNNNNTPSSDEDEQITNKKSKRQRLDSGSSHDTLVIDEECNENEAELETTKIDYTLKEECDSITTVTRESETESEDKADNNKVNMFVMENIITVCCNKILSKFEKDRSLSLKSKADKESQLRHKVLSIGSKILNNSPLNCTGLLRYLEYKNIDVIPKINNSNSTNYVRIHTKLRGKDNPQKTNNWKNVNNILKIETALDFGDILSDALNWETCNEDKSESTANVITTKLLNAYPVANPKQLPKKNSVECNTIIQKTHDNGDTNLVHTIISKQHDRVTESNGLSTSVIDSNIRKKQASHPMIKVRPVSELMPKNAKTITKNNDTNKNPPFICYSGSHSIPSGSTAIALSVTSLPSSTNCSRAKNTLNSVPNYVNIAPAPNSSIQSTMDTTNNRDLSNFRKSLLSTEFIVLNTVEFPHTATRSPFLYFKSLLEIYNIGLSDSKSAIPYLYKFLIKFKLGFHQENAVPVSLCLSLTSDEHTFCVHVSNSDGIDIDINKMTPHWQWEILQALSRNEIVHQLYCNASKISPMMLEATKKFINYLKSIEQINQVLS